MTTHTPITPYVAARVASKLLGRPVSEQTMFNLARTGGIETTEVPGTKKIHFDGNAFAAWLRQKKNNPKGSRTDYASLEDEYREGLIDVEDDPYKY
jgi:hypothetical protein